MTQQNALKKIKELEQNHKNFEDTIRDLYINQFKTFRYITKEYKIQSRLIKIILNHYNIPIRYGSEAIKSQWVNNDKRKEKQSLFLKTLVESYDKSPRLISDEVLNNYCKKLKYTIKERIYKKDRTYLIVSCDKCKTKLNFTSRPLKEHFCKLNKNGTYSTISAGEKIIEHYLIENHIDYKKEYYFKDLKLENYLRFDFAIFKNNLLYCLIEYDGRQHFDISSKFYSESLINRDNIKSNYCKENNIKLIRIPFIFKDRINDILQYYINH